MAIADPSLSSSLDVRSTPATRLVSAQGDSPDLSLDLLKDQASSRTIGVTSENDVASPCDTTTSWTPTGRTSIPRIVGMTEAGFPSDGIENALDKNRCPKAGSPGA
jgi:hypothetical protein